jgi:membrane-bound lytic murein transglycosylase MltF
MKKKIFIYALLLIAFVSLLFVLLKNSPEKRPRDFKAILASDRISVVADNSFLGFMVAGDSVYGFQYEIMKAFADKYELELQFTQENDFEEAMSGLQNGDFDVYAGFIPVYADLKEKVLFSSALKKSRLMLVQQDDSLGTNKINKQYELGGDSIFVSSNSPYIGRIRNLSIEIADSIYIIEVKDVSTENLIEMVSLSKIKNTICLENEAQILKLKYSNIDISLPIGFKQQHAWAMNKKSVELAVKINEFLDEYIESAEYWRIYRKYFNQEY